MGRRELQLAHLHEVARAVTGDVLGPDVPGLVVRVEDVDETVPVHVAHGRIGERRDVVDDGIRERHVPPSGPAAASDHRPALSGEDQIVQPVRVQIAERGDVRGGLDRVGVELPIGPAIEDRAAGRPAAGHEGVEETVGVEVGQLDRVRALPDGDGLSGRERPVTEAAEVVGRQVVPGHDRIAVAVAVHVPHGRGVAELHRSSAHARHDRRAERGVSATEVSRHPGADGVR